MKYYGLKDELREIAESCEYDKNIMWSYYNNFYVKHPTLTRKTYGTYISDILGRAREGYTSEKSADVGVSIGETENVAQKGTEGLRKPIGGDVSIPEIEWKEKSENFTRVLLISDLHAGHIFGLTPPSWWQNLDNEIYGNAAKVQREMWRFFTETIKNINDEHQIDKAICVGDMIDGSQSKTSGSEAICSDVYEQVLMAKESLEVIGAKDHIFCYGSNYHSNGGGHVDAEKILADAFDAKIAAEVKVRINGKIFRAKHHIGNSSVPYTKMTQIMKAKMMDIMRSAKDGSEIASVEVRAHVHTYNMYSDGKFTGIVLPCFQSSSKFGSRYFDGSTDLGFVIVDVFDSGEIEVRPFLASLKSSKTKIIDF